jgi:PAS domain S-box-containing protein
MSIKILVVDDDPNLQKATCRVLDRAGYETLPATTGQEALELTRTKHPDLLLLDVTMPGMDGFEVCRRIKSDPDLSETYILLFSGNRTDSESQADGLDSGADGYISRPIPNRELLSRIKAVLRLKDAQAAMHESELRYRIMFERASDGILFLSTDLKIIEVNQSFARMHGYPVEELKDMDLRKLDAPDSTILVLERVRRILAGESIKFVAQHIHKDGHSFPVEVSSSLITYNGVNLIQAFHRDISDRMQMENLQDAIYRIAQAADQSKNLDSLYPSIHTIIKDIMAAENFYIALYDEMEDLLSFPYSMDEMDPEFPPKKPGKGATELVLRSGKSLLCTEAVYQKLMINNEIEQVGAHSPIWLGVPLIVEAKTIGVMAVQDYQNPQAYNEREQRILEFVSSQVAMAIHRKQAEQNLRKSRDLQQAIIQTTLDGYWMTDMQGCLLEVNEAYCRMSGYSSRELLGMRVSDLEEKETGKETSAHIRRIVVQGPDRFETCHHRKDGSVFEVEVSVQVHPFEGGRLVAFLQDITARKQAEKELKAYSGHLEEMVAARTLELHLAEEQLVRQEKLAVLGQMAGSIGHELRTPISVINSAIYYLKLIQPDADDRIRKHHAMIEQEVHNADKIITDLLDFARIKTVQRMTVSIPDLVRNVLIRFPVPPSVKTILRFSPSLPDAFADPDQMQQVIGNLVVNAWQAMPDGGKLTISTRQQNEMLAVTVRDTGVGIPPENLMKLYEPLFSTKKSGIGLGLPVSLKLAEANGGRIDVQSQVGKGSKFTLFLPIST